jgi:hypothetical protein
MLMQFVGEKSLGSWACFNGLVRQGWRDCND